jgi:hypothetical protein
MTSLLLIAELSDASTAADTPAWSLLGSPPNCQTAPSLLETHFYLAIVDISEMDDKSLGCVHSAVCSEQFGSLQQSQQLASHF